MECELKALLDNETWIIYPRPRDQHVINSKWVYKLKAKADGSIDRFEATLVAKGFEQRDGVTTLRLLVQ